MSWSSQWNMGRVFGLAQCVIAVAASIGYFVAKDYRRALYWSFVACIEATITW